MHENPCAARPPSRPGRLRQGPRFGPPNGRDRHRRKHRDVTASDGARLKLSELRGKPVVLYFYPRDETPGCTKEACSFRDGWDALQKKGVVMIGVSMDDDASHNAFADHYKLPFHLVSDPDGSLAHAYGVPMSDDPKSGKTTDRQTIVISRDGDVKKIYRTVNVSVHAAQIQADVTS